MKLRTKILLIALLPIILLGVGIYLLAADRIANGIYDQAYAGMEIAVTICLNQKRKGERNEIRRNCRNPYTVT